jgi:hypothetical protein
MIEKILSCAFILSFLGWQIASRALNAGARADDSGQGSFTQATPQESQPAFSSADRDAAIAEIKKRIAGHEDEPAEKVFKNIEILKGKNASRLPGMMLALTGLLGVNCTYCHVRDQWDREEKPAKQTARKMFLMIGTINDQFFDRQNKVSCWTCHRGNPHPPIQG